MRRFCGGGVSAKLIKGAFHGCSSVLRQSERTAKTIARLAYLGWRGDGHRSGARPSAKASIGEMIRCGWDCAFQTSSASASRSPCRVRAHPVRRGSRRTFRLGCRPMWAKAKVRSRQWSYRGLARFTSRRGLEIPVTSPWTLHARMAGAAGRRFYVICEADRSFRAISAGHGGGRDLNGVADFANGRRCAKNFGNAMDSELTAGGAYVTSETKTSFKGYYRVSASRRRGFPPPVRAV